MPTSTSSQDYSDIFPEKSGSAARQVKTSD